MPPNLPAGLGGIFCCWQDFYAGRIILNPREMNVERMAEYNLLFFEATVPIQKHKVRSKLR